jgi:hypothetical protein
VTVVVASLSLGLVEAAFGGTAAVHAPAPSVATVLRAAAAEPNPYSTGMPAQLAIGQDNLTWGVAGSGATGLDFPVEPVLDASGDLWLTDTGHNRVLEFVPPFTTGMAASVVLGQSSFSGTAAATSQTGLNWPTSVAFNGAGDLWVSDSDNNRVLEYAPPFSTGEAATLVLGQATFTTSNAATSASNLSYPALLAITSSGDLLVTDSNNNRVVEYAPPFTDGMSASVVLGQASLTTSAAGTSATNMSNPQAVTVNAAGDVFVADVENNRVLEFTPPLSNGMAASVVLGQATFAARGAAATAVGMSDPVGVAVDARGDLWVADASNNRVLEYVPPFATGMAASLVLGQVNLTQSVRAATATGLDYPLGVSLDTHGDLWVADSDNNRVVEYVPVEFPVQFAEGGLAYKTNWSVTFGGTTHSSTTGWITFPQVNGSYAWSVGSVGGYAVAPASGTAFVNGTTTTVVIVFTSTSTGAAASWFWPVVTSVLLVVFVIDTALAVMLFLRGRRPTARPPPQVVEPASSPPAGGGPPPPVS